MEWIVIGAVIYVVGTLYGLALARAAALEGPPPPRRSPGPGSPGRVPGGGGVERVPQSTRPCRTPGPSHRPGVTSRDRDIAGTRAA